MSRPAARPTGKVSHCDPDPRRLRAATGQHRTDQEARGARTGSPGGLPRTDANQAVISKFTALIEAQKTKIMGQASSIQAEAGAYSADVGRFTAEIQGMTAEKELETRMIEARLRNNLALFEVQIKEYDATVARLIQIANLKVEAMRSAGQIASSIASGAMSAMHVGATLSGSGSLSGSDSLSINKNYNYEG